MKRNFNFFKNAKQMVWVTLMILMIPFVQSCIEEPLGGGDTDLEPDTEVPSIYILNPTSEEMFVTIDKNLVISGTAHDNKALKTIRYNSSVGNNGTAVGLENWSIQDLELAEGDNMIQVTAVDESDNAASASITITKNKYLVFLGIPYVDNDVLFANQPQDVWITAAIAPNDNLIASSVRLIEIDNANNEVAEVCRMYDDGNLAHGDEIKGDNVFSIKHSFNYPTEGTKRFRISAKTMEAEGEVEGFSAIFSITVMNQQNVNQQVNNVLNLHQQIDQMIKENSTMSAQEKESMVMSWLQTQPSVKKAESDNGFITITHYSGMESYVMLTDSNSGLKGGYTGRSAVPALPLSKQTRGIMASLGSRKAAASSSYGINSETIIQNKNVLIWAPFENSFGLDMETSLRPIIDACPVSLHLDYVINENCTRASLLELHNYGIIIFDTHGHGGNVLLTRETVNTSNMTQEEINNLYTSEYNVVSGVDGEIYYGVSAKFFRDKLSKTLPNSIVFNGSCQSMKTTMLANAFINKGAKTYLGFTENVMLTTCCDKADEFFSALMGSDLKTTGQSYIPDLDFVEQNNLQSWTNSYMMTGSTEMRFYMGLINGDFELGNLNGWNTSGDGRVITQLGSEKPTQGYYMGILSTGLGYTEKYGSISQSFKINNENNLSINWNFLSEEFLEYVGSPFQDYLHITISDGINSTVLFSMAIDDFAATYSLVKVSPTIVFDRGDVYMTGWQTSTFDISQYKGKIVTLTIETGDIGDSIFDSVTLLDEISIY
ncbi:MAG: hypothetical protein IKZ92_07055 [Muribaculaceae bacterium]|nr:hypothetical protein [Muribaculaceae bacterium]